MAEAVRIRPASESDCLAVVELEKKVWGGLGAPSINAELFHKWLKACPESFLVAVRGEIICGYVYQELVHFDPLHMDSAEWQKFLNTRYLDSHHCPDGNALIGLSIAAYPPDKGVGKMLLREAAGFFFKTKKKYWITFSRIPGFAEFKGDIGRAGGFGGDERKLAVYYVVRCMELAGRKSGNFSDILVPSAIPVVRRRDPVLNRFVEIIDMEPYDIVVSGYEDPQSCNLAVLMVCESRV